MANEKIQAWVTKLCITSGIIKCVRGEVCSDISEKMLKYERGRYGEYAHGKDWHRTPEAALARAEEMRKTKIASLKKQLAKLESMTFSVSE